MAKISMSSLQNQKSRGLLQRELEERELDVSMCSVYLSVTVYCSTQITFG